MHEFAKAARASLRVIAGLFVVLAGLGAIAVLVLWVAFPPVFPY